ncbi:MAG: hypothetical protein CBB97_25870 [Candidatus Endolissoclinum sp. TMED37]|nr:MAG: hypothetical protein CBB97_25870 [Candidatus Endolissoclinum sp. TMED37]
MNYILMTGAPGSKWSSVFKSIHSSNDIDSTDYTEQRTYWHDADTPGMKQLMHTGAYWDPGMEFDCNIEEWDKPFTGVGKRIIKSHTFAHRLEKLKKLGYPIVIIYRNDYECLEWWKLCGEFNITYPNYQHFENLDKMWEHIQSENNDIMQFIKSNRQRITSIKNSFVLCKECEISFPENKPALVFGEKDIKVYLYK